MNHSAGSSGRTATCMQTGQVHKKNPHFGLPPTSDCHYDKGVIDLATIIKKERNAMIHFTCDGCGQPIEQEFDVRYVVRMEVYASLDPTEEDHDNDRDHLQEIQDILESLDDAEDVAIGDDVYQQVRYDLCGDCRKRFLRNPLSRLRSPQFDFSDN